MCAVARRIWVAGVVVIACQMGGLGYAQEASQFASAKNWHISTAEFFFVFQNAVRNRYYHGTVPEAQLAAFQREVGNQLVERRAAAIEAKLRGLQPDPVKLDSGLAKWGIELDMVEPEELKEPASFAYAFVVESELQKLLELDVKAAVAQPSNSELRAYYNGNQELFTEPGKAAVSLILLKVDPWERSEVWRKTEERANQLYAEISGNNLDFASAAREHSQDPSAETGGDIGFQHQGQLAPAVESALGELEVGEITRPIRVLEGFVIAKLNDRLPAQLSTFDSVTERATALYLREKSETQWQEVLQGLLHQQGVTINESIYLPLQQSDP